MNALRRIAALASDYLELGRSVLDDGAGDAATLSELRAALEELRQRFPYTLDAPAAPGFALLLPRAAPVMASSRRVAGTHRR